MKIFGFEITRAKQNSQGQLLPPSSGGFGWPASGFGGWFNVIRESFPGAWQRNVEIRLENVLTFAAVYACITLISSDIGKLCLKLVQKNDDDIWEEVQNPAFSPVLRKPNHFQTRQKFIEHWVTSKLVHGNTFILKERDNRNIVVRLYVLDPQVTRVLISPDGSIFYQLATNRLAGIDGLTGVDLTEVTGSTNYLYGGDSMNIFVPASEIIHDVYVPLYHPLVGVSPISACGLAAMQGLAIQNDSARFFQNGAQPGGLLMAPGPISDETAKRLKDYWEANFTGVNSGRLAVLGDGLQYQPLTVNAQDAQLINQLKWTNETVCTAFKVPPYMVGIGTIPSYSNVESINLQYYMQCLQPLMEAIEALMDDGLGMVGQGEQTIGTEFELDDLLKMDTNTQYKTYGEGVNRGILTPNEAREKVGLGPVVGGDSPMMQQQNYSLAALYKRDAKEDPFATNKPPAPAKPPAEIPPAPPAKQIEYTDWDAVRSTIEQGAENAGL